MIIQSYDLVAYGANRDGVDGKFGSMTETAVMRYQEDNGLEIDGVCGKLTWKALQADVDASDPDTPEGDEPTEILITATIADLSVEDKTKVAEEWPKATFQQQRKDGECKWYPYGTKS